MRKLIGFLCYLCLISAIGFGSYYFYLNVAPFYKGAELRHYYHNSIYFWNENNTSASLNKLSVNGIDKSDAALLGGFIENIKASYTNMGLDAGLEYMFDNEAITKKRMTEGVIAFSAIANADGKVIASYPNNLSSKIGHVQVNNEIGWRAALGRYIENQQFIKVFPLQNSQGKQIGSIAFVMERYGKIAIIPPQSRVNAVIPPFQTALLALTSLLAFMVLLPVWVAKDADSRGMRAFAWAALVVLTGPFGLLAYFIARPASPKSCPNCGEPVFSKYNRCPACGTILLNRCPICGKKMKPGWLHCPDCIKTNEPQHQPEHFESNIIPVQQDIGNTLPNTSKHLKLKVTIVDSENMMPIADAVISIAGQASLTGITDKSGVFEAKKLLSGSYEVKATKQGFDSAQTEIEVMQDTENSVQLVLKALPGKIVGRVLDKTKLEPISGARVFIDSSRLNRPTTTDTDGNCVLGDIPASPYTVCADADKHISQTRLAEVEPGGYVTIDFVLEAAIDISEQEIDDETK